MRAGLVVAGGILVAGVVRIDQVDVVDAARQALDELELAAGQDLLLAMLAGADRDFVAALIFPDLDACRRLAPDLPKDAPATAIVAHEGVRREFRFLLNSLARAATGSSNRVARAMLMEAPPSLDLGEATDKGSLNQRMVLQARAALVGELYAETPPARVIAIDERI